MLKYILFLFFLTRANAFELQCNSCKYFIPHLSKNPELGLCQFFKNKPYENKNVIVYEFATHCRNNDNQCGPNGLFYETILDHDKQDFVDKYENLANSCCGEVNEKSDIEELEQLEKDFFEIYQKIRRHNTKKVYKTAKDIYKLFKKNKN